LAPFFRRFTVSLEEIDRLRELANQGVVLYVMRTSSVIDYLYFNFLYQKEGLPVARFANGIRTVFWRPLWQVLRRAIALIFARLGIRRFRGYAEADFLTSVTQAGESSMIFMRSSRTFLKFPTPAERESLQQALVRLQQEVSRPIYLVPQIIFWHKRPKRLERSLTDILFGATDYPGKLRKLGIFLRNFNRATVHFAEAVPLRDFLEGMRKQGEIAHAPRKLWLMLRYHLAREERVISGPPRRSQAQVIEDLLGFREVRDELIEISREQERPLEEIEKEARKILKEIVADYNPRWVEFLYLLLTFIWKRLFEGLFVDEEGFRRLRELAKDRTIVLLPNHRSHVDYLVLAYLFYQRDMTIPHIAAGINLSFWPLGPIFRSAGAFFIRRSFRGDRLYSLLLEKYLKTLVRRGHPMEFFIEGTRSRTGKMLPPKLGLLGMIVRAGHEVRQDVAFVPISIAYERILEERAYTEELEGKSKQTESIGVVVKAGRFLVKKFGRVHVQIGEPLFLSQSASIHGAAAHEDPLREVVQNLGVEICRGINRVTTVTPMALLSILLLSHTKRGISQEELLLRFRFHIDRFRKEGIRISEAFNNPEASFSQGLQILERSGLVHSLTIDNFSVYYVSEGERKKLDYYKNNIIHFFLGMGLAATALLSYEEEEIPLDHALQRYHRLCQLLRKEFFWLEGGGSETSFNHWLNYFVETGLLQRKDSQSVVLLRRGLNRLHRNRGLIENFLEGYLAVAKAIAYHRFQDLEEREILRSIQRFCERLYALGDVLRRESISSVLIREALSFFEEEGAILRAAVEKEDKVEYRWKLPPAGTKKIRELQEEFAVFLR
jgi:glycerol-3-phosphate O-acyltransferase